MDYSYLRREYPETISMDQLYRICHISKRKARWLLEHGVIPYQDSSKQTRRFSIRLEDVICFLKQRDAGLLDGVIPQGIFSSSSPHPGCWHTVPFFVRGVSRWRRPVRLFVSQSA